MAGKTYVGNGSNLSAKPKKIYVGNSNNQAAAAKAIYVGNSSNKAVKVWPMNVIPDTNYQQIEYIGGVGSNNSVEFENIISPKIYENPRIVIKFKVTAIGNFLFGSLRSHDQDHVGWNFRVVTSSDHGFTFSYGNFSTQTGHYTFEKATKDVSGDGIHLNKMYIVDYNNISNNISRFYLYCEEGYYSIASNNLIGSVSTVTSSPYSGGTSDYNYIRLGAYIDNITSADSRYYGGIRFYSCKIYNSSNSLIRNLYPCRNVSTGGYGFYDMVNRIYIGSRLLWQASYDVGPDYEGEL